MKASLDGVSKSDVGMCILFPVLLAGKKKIRIGFFKSKD